MGQTLWPVECVPRSSASALSSIEEAWSQVPSGQRLVTQVTILAGARESATWYTELQDAIALVRTTRQSVRPDAGGVFMTVETGTGNSVRTRRLLELP